MYETRTERRLQGQRALWLLVATVVFASSCSSVYAFRNSGTARSIWGSSLRQTRVTLWVASIATDGAASTQRQVVYEKAVRPSTDVQPNLFLANIVEYLQDRFTLPTDLPMTYDVLPLDNAEVSTIHGIVIWDSPLSTSSVATRMLVEVVGIYTDDTMPTSTVPEMAMVVVSKDQPSSTTAELAPMMRSLFADSEQRILKALDRGLDDFQLGKIQFSVCDSVGAADTPHNVRTVEEAIEAEIIGDGTVTAPVEGVREMATGVDGGNPAEYCADMARRNETVTSPGEDFAIMAARLAAARIESVSSSPEQTIVDVESSGGGYAVQAARRVSAVSPNPKVRRMSSDKSGTPTTPAPTNRVTISTPMQRAMGAKRTAGDNIRAPERRAVLDNEGIKTQLNVTVNVHEAGTDKETQEELKRPFEAMACQTVPASVDTEASIAATAPEFEQSRVENAQQVLEQLSRQARDLSPEELLGDIMKFGKKQDVERTPGRGFASGAFEKAKEILRERKQQRAERLSAAVELKETAKGSNSIDSVALGPGEVLKELSQEDELRQIFQAGERMANNHLERVASGEECEPTLTDDERKDQEQLEALIRGDTTVSSYGRSLDEELAELELRINVSPDEGFDAPPASPLFDVLSGPEIYDRNVDPETSVNWPGALPGSKTVRLPKQLGEAVKQAQFASDVLLRMKTVGNVNGGTARYFLGTKELSAQQVANIRSVVNEAVQIGLIDDPLDVLEERSRLQMLIDELQGQPEERRREIASNFKDLLVSDRFVALIRERLEAMADRDLDALRRGDESLHEAHKWERQVLGSLVEYAQLLLKEVRALGAELEASQLELVRSICKVAMDPDLQTEEETTNALTDAVRDMRPLLDDAFVAYLKYAVAEEEARLAREGLLDDPEHNEWLFVLKIVQQGVYTELAQSLNRHIENVWYVLRMETSSERRLLLRDLINGLPTMDVRPFVQVVHNIVASLGDTVRGEFDGGDVLGGMTNKLMQLHRDVRELLPPERIDVMSRDADDWAEAQKQKLLEQQRLTRQRLAASRDTHVYDDEIRSRGDLERFE